MTTLNQPAGDEMLEQMTPNQRRALDKGLAALETMAGLWAAEIRLTEMAQRISEVPDAAERATRIAAMIELGFTEGAYRCFLDHKDQIDELAAAPIPRSAATVSDERAALLADHIELNMSNYGPDDVDKLNAWAIEAYHFITRAASTVRPLPRASDAAPMTNGDFHCPQCGEVMKGPTACGTCLWEADTCGYAHPRASDEGVSEAARDVLAERKRQVTVEGFTQDGAQIRDADDSDHLSVLLCEIRAACGDNGERERDELVGFIGEVRRDAERYRAFFDSGLPICFRGVEYFDKASLDAAIAASAEKGDKA
ncbi:hypothetical protein [Paraburkholderia tuberum]|uniref:Uncharacterized protein n=1 Tax=Paraburkholderia tuberum TaxID=157910 RepID=A0A1H1JC55_9BURK|nr:hypothetical protein [Paraburkholderia tuberum]SDR47350.1 hypothetical protein SAMN05445850_4539 [Paraburkholderia tuberum]